MAACAVIWALFLTTCLIATSSAQESDDFQLAHTEPRPVGRAYSLVGCNYRFQAGYTCLSCQRALHCYPGNAAILVDCYGLFRYCRDGRCAARQGDKCPDTGDMSAVMIANNTLVATSPEIAAQAAAAELQAAQAAEVAQTADTVQNTDVANNAEVLEAQVPRDTVVTKATLEVLQPEVEA